MRNASRRSASAVLLSAPPWLQGLSWSGVALIALLFAIWASHWVLGPTRLIAVDGVADLVRSWLAFTAVVLVGGLTLFLSIVLLLNAATRVTDRFWVAVPVALLGCIIAALVSFLAGTPPTDLGVPDHGIAAALFWADWAMAIAVGYLVLLRMRAARDHANQIELQRKALEQRQLEARLRVLQAQIEPHFLFNTLSNIRRLCQSDAAGGRVMLAQLARYLRAALPKIRSDHASLADEVELASAYLDLQKMRMGERLQFSVDVPAELLGASVPPMMLATLAENAVQHGIAPLTEGGSIRISARRQGDALVVSVHDTGRGFVADAGAGVGLTNIRARLAAAYDGEASLALQANAPRGLVAAISLPWRRVRQAA